MIKIDPRLTEEQLEQARKVITLFLRDVVERSGTSGGLVAVSGGIDSALVLFLAVEALGADRTFGLMLHEEGINEERDLQDAVALAESLNVPYKVIKINPTVESVLKNVEDEIRSHPNPKLAIANAKPRVRMVYNYIFANLHNRLVLGTSNKTELLVGYSTKYGDNGVDVLPIGDLYKTQVRQLAAHVGVPERIVKKTPSAGLWKGQTDEEELGMSYELLDKILYGLVDLNLSIKEIHISTKTSEEEILRIKKLIYRNQHKRSTPPIARLTAKCLDKDVHLPATL